MELSGQFHAPPLYPQYPLYTRLGGPQNWSGSYREEKCILHLLGIKSQFLSLPDYSLVTVPTEPSCLCTKKHCRFLFHYCKANIFKIMVFWNLKLCSLVDKYQYFRRTCCLHLAGWRMLIPEYGGSRLLFTCLPNCMASSHRKPQPFIKIITLFDKRKVLMTNIYIMR